MDFIIYRLLNQKKVDTVGRFCRGSDKWYLQMKIVKELYQRYR